MEPVSQPTSTPTPISPTVVYVSIQGKDPSKLDGIYLDENVALLKKCKECIIQRWLIDDSKFIS